MKLTLFITVLITAYLVFCGVLIVQTGLFQSRTEQDDDSLVSLAAAPARNGNTPAEQTNASNVSAPAEPASAFDLSDLVGISAKPQTVTLGSLDPESGFKYELVLTSTGAAVSRATLSEFDDRNPDDPRPLILLSPLHNRETGRTLAVNGFETGPRSFPLGKLDWQVGPKTTDPDGARESVSFTAILNDSAGRNALKFTRTYRLQRDSYSLDCDLTVENLTDQPIRSKFQLQGPEGIGREGTGRDTRDIVAAFLRSDGTVESTRKDQAKLEKAAKRGIAEDLKLGVKYPDAHFLWAAVTNKYFTAIVRPVPRGEELYAQEIQLGPAQFVNPRPESQGEENISFTLSSQPFELSPAGADQASASFAVQLYLGSKDKGIFDKNELYDRLGYLHTINFMGCCCPQSLIRPLAFAIMSLMKWMYTMMGPLGNYGVVIMILVLLVRLLLHPITKKSQVNMMAMQKINSHPRMEEIKKKY
ncbi:MAG: YidC/Oxa1 family insertase periplasmic-domain containing protein, partial [Sedimentisphaerales bacterium]|nr:YidC/Oxa1 family insertase periplasmic-domain containing protein [Sedimentisphaerales bacterium]